MGDTRINLPQKGREVAVRYVLLHHTGLPPEHFDLMIQLPAQENLVTWRILTPPTSWRDAPPAAQRIADHRPAYLEYEGELSGGRGQVKRIAAGNAHLRLDLHNFELHTSDSQLHGIKFAFRSAD